MLASETGDEWPFSRNTRASGRLPRLRAIYRRATEYRLPSPHWDDPGEYPDLEDQGREAIVFPSCLAGGDEAGEERSAPVPTADAERFDEPSRVRSARKRHRRGRTFFAAEV